MGQTIAVERVRDVAETAQVRHYDELDERAKEQFPALADHGGSRIPVDRSVAAAFNECELVKYTEYYRIHFE